MSHPPILPFPPIHPSVHHELVITLVRHLPLGLEGVGMAQAQAVVRLLSATAAFDQPVPRHGEGLALLSGLAGEHVPFEPGWRRRTHLCGSCREPWPCRMRRAAGLLDATRDARPVPCVPNG